MHADGSPHLARAGRPDNYVELQARYPWLRERGRVLGATLTHGIWIFAPRTCVAARRHEGALRT